MEKINLFKWFVDLNGEGKSVIALLLALNLYFGYTSYASHEDYKVMRADYLQLFKLYNSDTKDCADRILKVNVDWNERMDRYRNLVEEENKQRIKDWEKKYDVVVDKLDNSNYKLKRTEQIIQNINKKIK